jgi:hypothetical protein
MSHKTSKLTTLLQVGSSATVTISDNSGDIETQISSYHEGSVAYVQLVGIEK